MQPARAKRLSPDACGRVSHLRRVARLGCAIVLRNEQPGKPAAWTVSVSSCSRVWAGPPILPGWLTCVQSAGGGRDLRQPHSRIWWPGQRSDGPVGAHHPALPHAVLQGSEVCLGPEVAPGSTVLHKRGHGQIWGGRGRGCW